MMRGGVFFIGVLVVASVGLAQSAPQRPNEPPVFRQADSEQHPPAQPATAYWNVTAELSLAAVTPDTHIQMLLPLSDGRQSIVARQTQANGLQYWEETDGVNLWGHWRVLEGTSIPQQIIYTYTVQIVDTKTPLPQYPFPFQNMEPEVIPYLAASEMIQSNMPQVLQRAWSIVQTKTRLDQAMQALFGFVHSFALAEDPSPPARPSHPDALSVLTAGRGDRSGKARALVAILRAVGIPARMVGGIQLGDRSQKRPSLYWAEAYLGERWIPMDPTGGYFGWLPNTYLALYRNDLPLLVHTQHGSVPYTFTIQALTRRTAVGTGISAERDVAEQDRTPGEQPPPPAVSVDQPHASVVLINEGPLAPSTVETMLSQARTVPVNITVLSTQMGGRAFRQASFQTVLEQHAAVLRAASLIVVNTTDAAGLYALLKHAGNQESLDHTALSRAAVSQNSVSQEGFQQVRWVIASGVAASVGRVFAAVLYRVYAPAEVLFVPHQADPLRLWDIVRDSVSTQTRLVQSAARFAISHTLIDEATLAEWSWWRQGVVGVWVQALHSQLSLPGLNAILVIPLIAFFLVLIRNVIGLETFGFFAPMLLALAFLSTGLGWGLLIFGIIISIGGILRLALQGLRLHMVARVAVLIAIVAVSLTGLNLIGAQFGIGGLLRVGIFPMVIIANMIENFTNTQMERGTREALRFTSNTLLVAMVSYLGIENTDLRPIVLAFPEVLVGVIGLELLIGCWRGLRLVEYVRFARLLRQAERHVASAIDRQ